jgi:formylmethanofuran dehydrogenase subunit B
VSWRTGYPFCVNLSRGYPRYNPGEFNTAVALARKEVDVAMVLGNDPMPSFTDAVHEHLRSIPHISIAADESDLTRGATVAFATATFSRETRGTVYRMDEVPLALPQILQSP